MKVGDRVKVIHVKHLYNNKIRAYDKGTIIGYYNNGLFISIGVEFDEDINGHDCGGIGKRGHCTWIRKNHLVLLGDNE